MTLTQLCTFIMMIDITVNIRKGTALLNSETWKLWTVLDLLNEINLNAFILSERLSKYKGIISGNGDKDMKGAISFNVGIGEHFVM